MFRLGRKCSSVFSNENLRFLSAFAVAAMADTSPVCVYHETSVNSNSKTPKTFESPISTSLDPTLYISELMKCTNVLQVREIHGQVTSSGMLHNLAVANKLLYTYVQHKLLTDAYVLFGDMKERDAVTWSVIVGGFAKMGDYANCFDTFRELIRFGIPRPDNYTLPSVIRACRDSLDLEMGKSVHDLVVKLGFVLDHFVSAALVDMYAKCRVIEDAGKLFDKMPNKDIVTWTVMIGAFAECGNAIVSLALFDRMIEAGVVPDKISLVTVVYACAKLGAMNKAKLVDDYIYRNRFSLDVILGTAMIDMYSKCGSVDSARKIFDRMRNRNVISWSAMIAAYGYHGQGRKALDLFPLMLGSGISPNRVTFLSLLYACSHAGLVAEGLRIFSSMLDDYGVRPDVKHYTCVVDLLGRAGRLDEAFNLIEKMTIEKDEGLWGAMLAACRIHKHIDMAEMAAKSLLELQPRNPGHYVLLSNIYANVGRWADVAMIRDLMTQMRLKKIPGRTWIEVDNKIYQFGVGDSTHPRAKEINGMLAGLSKKLELAGYVPDTNFVLHDVDEEVKIGILSTHSEKLAIAFGLIATPRETPIRITKNLQVCGDCHTFCKFVSAITHRMIIVRDANRFHHFEDGVCSCGDYW